MPRLRHIFIAIPIILLAACSNKNPEGTFELKGKINNWHGEKLYLDYMSTTSVTVLDSLALNNKGEFEFKTTKIKETGFYRLRISDRNFTTFIFSPNEKVTLTADATNLVESYDVKGSPESELLMEINRVSLKNFHQRDSLQRYYQLEVNSNTKTPAQLDSLGKAVDKEFSGIVLNYYTYLQNFVTKHNSSIVALAAIQQLSVDEYFSVYQKLDETLYAKLPNSEYVKSFHISVGRKAAATVGAKAPEIIMNTPEGQPLALSSLRGKVVLIDFWASWCGPCRMENPNVVAAYAKYKDKGFDIYSVSLDKDVEKWKGAIVKDNLMWKNHVSDLNAWQSPVVQLYGFSGIPYNVLINKEGVIIAQNLRGEALEQALSQVFK